MRQAKRHIRPLSHDAAKPRCEEIVPLVEMPSLVLSCDRRSAPSPESPVDARKLPIEHLSRPIGDAEIDDAVVVPDPVVMVDLFRRLDPVVEKPRDSVRHVQPLENFDADVPVMVGRSGDRSRRLGAARDLPRNNASFRVVAQDIPHFIWDNDEIHLKSPLHLARGWSASTGHTPDYTP